MNSFDNKKIYIKLIILILINLFFHYYRENCSNYYVIKYNQIMLLKNNRFH